MESLQYSPPTKEHSCTAMIKMHLKRTTTEFHPELWNSVRFRIVSRDVTFRQLEDFRVTLSLSHSFGYSLHP